MSQSQYLSLAGMALQVEFGDFSPETHNEVYFDLEHYVPNHVYANDDAELIRNSLIKLHKAHLCQSQSKTEIKFCKELQRNDNYGFHFFKVFTDKKMLTSKLLGVHIQGLFLFEPSKNISHPHRIVASYFWHKITRIQYDNGKFQLLVQDEPGKSHKLKFYTVDGQSKVMFDLSSACHQHSNQLRLKASVELEYKEPQRAIRTLKRKLMPRRQSSQHKLYTTNEELTRTTRSGSMRRSTTCAPSSMPKSSDSNYLVKRLAHYSSMADALVSQSKKNSTNTNAKDSDLNASDKENKTPDKNYR